VRDEQIKVVNTSNVVAYDVSIQPKESPLYKAEFKTIARLEKDHPVYVEMDLCAKPSGTFYRQFEALLKSELENSSEDDNFNLRVPMIVQFYDDKKRIYTRRHTKLFTTPFGMTRRPTLLRERLRLRWRRDSPTLRLWLIPARERTNS
jgi:hypothetical protein